MEVIAILRAVVGAHKVFQAETSLKCDIAPPSTSHLAPTTRNIQNATSRDFPFGPSSPAACRVADRQRLPTHSFGPLDQA
eukprot:6174851-Pleurochrysis_carterae.AAC.2